MIEQDQVVLAEISEMRARRHRSARFHWKVSMVLALSSMVTSMFAAILVAYGLEQGGNRWVAVIAAVPAVVNMANALMKPSARSLWHRRYALELDDLEAEAKFNQATGLDLEKKFNQIKRNYANSAVGWL